LVIEQVMEMVAWSPMPLALAVLAEWNTLVIIGAFESIVAGPGVGRAIVELVPEAERV
jgi:hypothetical protein